VAEDRIEPCPYTGLEPELRAVRPSIVFDLKKEQGTEDGVVEDYEVSSPEGAWIWSGLRSDEEGGVGTETKVLTANGMARSICFCAAGAPSDTCQPRRVVYLARWAR
jgi:hypothetical protein